MVKKIRTREILRTVTRNLEGIIGEHNTHLINPEPYLLSEDRMLRHLLTTVINGRARDNQIALITAFAISAYVHRGENLNTGGAYIEHPVNVTLNIARTARNIWSDYSLIIPTLALMHDSPETLLSQKTRGNFSLRGCVSTREDAVDMVMTAYEQSINDMLSGSEKQAHYHELPRLRAALFAITRDPSHAYQDDISQMFTMSDFDIGNAVSTVKSSDRTTSTRLYRQQHPQRHPELRAAHPRLSPQRRYAMAFKNFLVSNMQKAYVTKYPEALEHSDSALMRAAAQQLRLATITEFNNLGTEIINYLEKESRMGRAKTSAERADKIKDGIAVIAAESQAYEITEEGTRVTSVLKPNIFDGIAQYWLAYFRESLSPADIRDGYAGINAFPYTFLPMLGVSATDFLVEKTLRFFKFRGLVFEPSDVPILTAYTHIAGLRDSVKRQYVKPNFVFKGLHNPVEVCGLNKI